MANTKKAIEEVTEKEIPRAAYEGVLTIDVDAQVESAQEQEDTRWHQLLKRIERERYSQVSLVVLRSWRAAGW